MGKRLAVVVFLAALGAVPETVLAIPAFARRYKVACHFCHEGFPKLNAAGQRFKDRGFRMAKEDRFDADKWLRSFPAVIRARANHEFVEEGDDNSFAFLKGVSAGNLGKRVSYWVDDGILIDGEGEDDVTHAKPDNAWVRFEVVKDRKLYAKAGRFELDIPFTQIRSPHLYSYDIYFANTGFESDTIGDYHHGIEVGGELSGDVRWSAALVAGRNPEVAGRLSDEADKFDGNLFLRARKQVGRHRFGAFAYIGRNTIVLAPNFLWDDNLLRLGVDGSAWRGRLNVYGVAMYGRNDNSIATFAQPEGTMQALKFAGGFLQGDYHMRDHLALTVRLNVVNEPPGFTTTENETFTSVFPGIQVWAWEHLKFSFEYGFLNKDRPGFGAVQAEVAF